MQVSGYLENLRTKSYCAKQIKSVVSIKDNNTRRMKH